MVDFLGFHFSVRFERHKKRSVEERAELIRKHCVLLQNSFYNWAMRTHIRNLETIRNPSLPIVDQLNSSAAFEEWRMFCGDQIAHEIKLTFPFWETPQMKYAEDTASLRTIAELAKENERDVIKAVRGPRPPWEPPLGGIIPGLCIPTDAELDASWEEGIDELQECLAEIRSFAKKFARKQKLLSRYQAQRNKSSHISHKPVSPLYIHELDTLYAKTKETVSGVLLGFTRVNINVPEFESHEQANARDFWGNLTWIGSFPNEHFEIRDANQCVWFKYTRDGNGISEVFQELKRLRELHPDEQFTLVSVHTHRKVVSYSEDHKTYHI